MLFGECNTLLICRGPLQKRVWRWKPKVTPQANKCGQNNKPANAPRHFALPCNPYMRPAIMHTQAGSLNNQLWLGAPAPVRAHHLRFKMAPSVAANITAEAKRASLTEKPNTTDTTKTMAAAAMTYFITERQHYATARRFAILATVARLHPVAFCTAL